VSHSARLLWFAVRPTTEEDPPLRTEGFEVSDISAVAGVVSLAEALEPDVVLIDAGAGARLHETSARLRRLAHPPTVVMTSSAAGDQFDARATGLPFLHKADACARAIKQTLAAARGLEPSPPAS
jgi:DNA-binding NarL/FixJ family response regulator